MTVEASSIWQKFKLPMALGGVSLFSIGVSGILLVKSTQTTIPIQFFDSREVLSVSRQASSSADSKNLIRVDVEGGVRSPGLYVLPSASRIADAIAKAGGLSEEADEELMAKQVNQASVLVDGAKVYVPKKGDESHINGLYVREGSTSYNPDPLLQRQETSQNGSVNINSASSAELDALPGVGPATAKKIIDNRPYKTLEELVSKKAIRNALFEKIKEKLSL